MGKFKVGDRVRFTRYWDGELGTIVELPGQGRSDGFKDHYKINGDLRGDGLFEPGSFESADMIDDRILTESGHWVHVKRPADAPKASMFGGGQIIPDLRDQFAMAALTGILASGAKGGGTKDPHEIVSIAAYAVADTMLAERGRAK